MSWWQNNPCAKPYQFGSRAEYLEAKARWEEAEMLAEDAAMERYYEKRLAGNPC